ncbi:MAG: anaerobic ribonucleoside-triphosphate reductase activating protein [Sulfolobales archaeon]|nr:anaerobic ribonucleoside-triphosphate reductase activating protein [Sulfolobales archaeon]MCX8199095.1 anaerobic ribonucleoside-triphosphate reductase activating protein [Sulfolobales archaeon]MDW8170074.1 anaerobic ribonucleoside-triphosphate reductase activating protein [Desulfurococcaceae archaeon]
MKVSIAGFKELSLIDVHGHTSFTLWFCGCNLLCPFCHNWRLAMNDPEVCREEDVDEIISVLSISSSLVEYLHITGGEPLLQLKQLIDLYTKSKSIGVLNSLNTNLTMPTQLEALLSRNLIEHLATDLKIPFPEMSGLGSLSEHPWTHFMQSLNVLKKYRIVVELRIPVAKNITLKHLPNYLSKVSNVINNLWEVYVVVNPLIGAPMLSPRDPMWAKQYCNPSVSEVEEVAKIVKEILGVKVYTKKWW